MVNCVVQHCILRCYSGPAICIWENQQNHHYHSNFSCYWNLQFLGWVGQIPIVHHIHPGSFSFIACLGYSPILTKLPANFHWCYITLCLSWSITEIIRYSYYASNLTGGVPYFLTWLRYTTFYVLYPTGVASEVYLIILSLNEAGFYYGWALRIILVVYIPGFYMLYTYMIKQRKKRF